jgi:hypothetical protein
VQQQQTIGLMKNTMDNRFNAGKEITIKRRVTKQRKTP